MSGLAAHVPTAAFACLPVALQCQLRFYTASFSPARFFAHVHVSFHTRATHALRLFKELPARACCSPRMPLLMLAAAHKRLASEPSGIGHRTGASKLVSTIAVDRYGFDGGWLASSGARGVCCFYPTPLSPDLVSILSIPHFRTPALTPCAHPHAKIRFVLIFSYTRSLALYLCSLSQEYIDARRPRREAADGSRHCIEYF